MSWVLINKHRLSKELTGNYKASEIIDGSDISILQVTEFNEHYLSGYIKFTADEIKAMRVSESIPFGGIEKQDSQDAFSSKKMKNGDNLFKRFHGIESVALLPNQTHDFILSVPYDHAKIECVEIVGAGDGVVADLMVHDDLKGTYTGVSNRMMDKFGIAVNIASNYHRFHSQYDANLYLGFQVICRVSNQHQSETYIMGVNVELNEVKK